MARGSRRVTTRCRIETPADEPFVRRVVTETIAEEFGAAAWPEPMRGSILGLQYDTRRSAARAAGGDITSQVIVADGEDVGWLLTSELPDQIRIVEIAILPDWRGNGVGEAAIRGVLERGARDGKPVRLVVTRTNARAIRLYERLGFTVSNADEVQQEMEWTRAEREPQ